MTAGILQLHFGESDTLAIEPLTDREAYLSITPVLAVPAYQVAVIVMMAWKGKTPGKKLLGAQVVARSSSRPPAAFKSIVRWAVPMAAVAPLVDAIARDFPEFAYLPSMDELPTLSGRLWWIWVAVGWWLLVHASALWDSQRRGWHDKAAGTIVIKAPRQAAPAQGHDLLAKWQRRPRPFIRLTGPRGRQAMDIRAMGLTSHASTHGLTSRPTPSRTRQPPRPRDNVPGRHT